MTKKEKDKKATAEKDIQKKGTVRDYWETLCLVLIFVLFARTWIFQNSNIPSGSMKDTLLVGDRLIVNSFIYGPAFFNFEKGILPMRDIKEKDIVVFKYPAKPEVPFIKRVIAKEGDVVFVKHQHVFVNGKELSEPYALLPEAIKNAKVEAPQLPPLDSIPELPDYLRNPEMFEVEVSPGRVDLRIKPQGEERYVFSDTFGPYKIPKGHYFVMGDNRLNSEDSRYWGALDKSMILGKAWLIWWSYEEGDYDYLKTDARSVLRKLVSKAVHFFDKTRWSRMFSRPS
ncbi:MAG: signal peptidase I [Acidobacteriota bacterium]